jgi:hypothetical protein
MMEEVWRNAVGFEGFYEISNFGSVRSKARWFECSYGIRKYGDAVLKPVKNNRGYAIVNLTMPGVRKQVTVHRLVLEAFSRTKHHSDVCRHLNGNKLDNSISNLVWGTPKENSSDSMRHGVLLVGEQNNLSRFSAETILAIITSTKKTSELVAEYGVSRTHVKRIRRHECWKHLNAV